MVLIMNIQGLNCFIAAASCGSFTAAARKLYVSQPNLSKSIEALENELGVRLFVRTNKGVKLTDDGAELLDQATNIINSLNDISEYYAHRQRKTKVLKLSIQPISPLIDMISEYAKNNSVSFNVCETNRDEVIRNVINSKSKIGFIMTCNMDPLRFNDVFHDNHLIYKEIASAQPLVFIRKNHPLSTRKHLIYDDLLPYSRILYNLDNYTRNSIIDKTECNLITNSVELVKRQLLATQDYLIQTPWDRDLLSSDEIICIPLIDKNSKVSLGYCFKQLDNMYIKFIDEFCHSF